MKPAFRISEASSGYVLEFPCGQRAHSRNFRLLFFIASAFAWRQA